VLAGVGPMAGGLAGFGGGAWHRSTLLIGSVLLRQGEGIVRGGSAEGWAGGSGFTAAGRAVLSAGAWVWPAGDKKEPTHHAGVMQRERIHA
jgi:hypothetical protein